MVVINVPRSQGQDGKPTDKKLIKAFSGQPLEKIPHRYFFPTVILKNLLNIKRTVLKNKEAYIRSGGGNKMTSAVINELYKNISTREKYNEKNNATLEDLYDYIIGKKYTKIINTFNFTNMSRAERSKLSLQSVYYLLYDCQYSF